MLPPTTSLPSGSHPLPPRDIARRLGAGTESTTHSAESQTGQESETPLASRGSTRTAALPGEAASLSQVHLGRRRTTRNTHHCGVSPRLLHLQRSGTPFGGGGASILLEAASNLRSRSILLELQFLQLLDFLNCSRIANLTAKEMTDFVLRLTGQGGSAAGRVLASDC